MKRAVAAAEAKAASEAEEHPSKKAKVEQPDGQLPVPDGPGLSKCIFYPDFGFKALEIYIYISLSYIYLRGI